MATTGTRLHAVLTAGYHRREASVSAPASTQDVATKLSTLVTPPTTLTSLRARGVHYIMVGENHFSMENKERLASEIARLATSGRIRLYVEHNPDASDIAKASDRLATGAGLPTMREHDPLYDSSNSLLAFLMEKAKGSMETFTSRPEGLQPSFRVDPELLSQVITLARLCADPRRQRVIEAINSIGSVSEEILGSAMYLADRLSQQGRIDSRLLPVVEEYLTERLINLRSAINATGSRPLVNMALDSIRPSDAPILEASYKCVFAPHVVSDSVFATRLIRETVSPKLVVVAAGQAHVDALSRMLVALSA